MWLALVVAGISLWNCVGAPSTAYASQTASVSSVLKSIAAAPKIVILPSNLTPSLEEFVNADAASDLSGVHVFASCDPYADVALATRPAPCFFGDLHSSKTIAIVGDSNVGNWVPALSLGLKGAGYRLAVFGYPGCPTPFLTYSNLGDQQTRECNLWHERVPQAIRALDPIALIAAAGASDQEGISNSTWIAGFKKLFTKSTGPTTIRILMGTSPIFLGLEPPECLSAHDNPQRCALSVKGSVYATYLARDPKIARAAKAFLIPTEPWFCVSDKCETVVSHYLTFADGDHVTTAFSNYLAPVVTAAVLARISQTS